MVCRLERPPGANRCLPAVQQQLRSNGSSRPLAVQCFCSGACFCGSPADVIFNDYFENE